ncbi:MAG: hypothetical protein JWR38_5433 [Mucilaginibacter sp.]|nr:hypothetical protein [Mucilaginibacter sp.]
MAQTYILVIAGKPEGPFNLEELKSLKVKPGDFVKTPEMDDYKEAHEIAELREIFGFAKPDLLMQYFASFDQRLLATALDWFMISGVFIILAFIIVSFIKDKETGITVALAILACVPFVKFIYQVTMESSIKQGTLGKQILKIRVVDLQGNRISIGKAINRNLCKIFSMAIFFIGYLLAFFSKQQQCLHDMMAGTLVIKERLF